MEESQKILCDLGDGIVLRAATSADIEPLTEFNGRIHEPAEPGFNRVAAWTHDLLSGVRKGTGPADFTVVEDTRSGKIVSSSCLLDHTFTYAGIPFAAGQPELVGTDSAYRGRGLVRLQMETLHDWSRQRGQLLTGITGIPYYYRQFGYEMTVQLDGCRIGYADNVPRLSPPGEVDAHCVRPAAAADMAFVADCYNYGARRSLLTCQRSLENWLAEPLRTANSPHRQELRIIETLEGKPVGFFGFDPILRRVSICMTVFELAPGVSWQAVMHTVLRALWAEGQKAAAQPNSKPCEAIMFHLGGEHPAYRAASNHLPKQPRQYAWYMRVPDLKAFLWKIAPALEQRLAASDCAGHSGALEIGFYYKGVRLVFAGGQVEKIEDLSHSPSNWPAAAFPGLSFLQLLLGGRTVEELADFLPDCLVKPDDALLLNALFPKQHSSIAPVY